MGITVNVNYLLRFAYFAMYFIVYNSQSFIALINVFNCNYFNLIICKYEIMR